MQDVHIILEDRIGGLAAMGAALGRAGISVEGGGAWVVEGKGQAHFLFEDGALAREVLLAAGFEVPSVRKVVVQRLRQDQPGQLGQLCHKMAEGGVNIEVLYSDHQNQLILVVDDHEKALEVSQQWQASWTKTPDKVIDK